MQAGLVAFSARTQSPFWSITCWAILRWQFSASTVTVQPSRLSSCGSFATTVILLDFAAVAICPRTNGCAQPQAETMWSGDWPSPCRRRGTPLALSNPEIHPAHPVVADERLAQAFAHDLAMLKQIGAARHAERRARVLLDQEDRRARFANLADRGKDRDFQAMRDPD
jgi:hypothetical protein